MKRVELWIAPSFTAALTVVFYGPLGFGRDFGAFIIGLIVLLPLAGAILVLADVWLLVERRPFWVGLRARSSWRRLLQHCWGRAFGCLAILYGTRPATQFGRLSTNQS
jgi:hypothetical protein